MPQHEHMERHKKLHGVRMDQMERTLAYFCLFFLLTGLLFLNRRKREARQAHKVSQFAQRSFGLRAKLFNQKRFKEKAAMKKTLALHQQGSNKHANDDKMTDGRSSHSYNVSLSL
jgi:ribosome biogenesis protein NSA2